MTDIATLGLAIDSRPVTTANAALNQLTAAAGRSQGAATGLIGIWQRVTESIGSLFKASSAGADTLSKMENAAKKAGTAHSALSTQAMSAQHSIRSMVEQLATGVPITTVLAQQVNHLSYAASGPGGLSGAFKEAAGSFSRLISPTTLLLGGFAAVAGTAYLLYSNIKQTELAFGALSERTSTTVAKLHAFESAAAFKGIDSEDFLKSMEKFGTLTDEARFNMGSLAELFRANGVQAGTLEQNFMRAAALIKNARDDAERYRIIQQLGLPATREWVQLLKQGPEGIQAAIKEAVAFGGAADEGLIQRARDFDEQWNRAWKNFSVGSKSAFVSALDGFRSFDERVNAGLILANKLGLISTNIGRNLLENAYTSGGVGTRFGGSTDVAQFYPKGIGAAAGSAATSGPTIDPNVLKVQIGLEQQRIGILGGLATVTETVRQKENELTLARLTPGSKITDADTKRILAYTQAQALGTLQIHQQADAERINAATIGLSIGQTAAFRAEQEKLADFRLRGIKLTSEQAEALKREAAALGEAAQKTAELKLRADVAFERSQIGNTDSEQQINARLRAVYGDQYAASIADADRNALRLNATLQQTSDLGKDALKGFLQDIRQGKSALDAMSGALDRIASKLVDMATDQLWAAAFGGTVRGTANASGGLFGNALGNPFGSFGTAAPTAHSGGIVGQLTGPMRIVHPAYFENAPRLHEGGMLLPGERPIIAKVGERVLTPEQYDAMGQGKVAVNITNNNDFRGADPGSEARLRAYVDARAKQTVLESVNAVMKTRANNPSLR